MAADEGSILLWPIVHDAAIRPTGLPTSQAHSILLWW